MTRQSRHSPWNHRVFVLLAIALLLLTTSTALSEAPAAWQVQVKVQAPDPANPGGYVPVQGIDVAFMQGNMVPAPIVPTDEAGLAGMSLGGQGLGLVYLSRPYDTQTGAWQGYVYDEHLTHLGLVGDPGPVQITITLVPRSPGHGRSAAAEVIFAAGV